MNVKPLGDKIIIKRAEAQGQTDSGIYLPESAKDTPKEGEIVATGKGILNKNNGEYMPFTVKNGDRVIFSSYAGTEIKIEGEDGMHMAATVVDESFRDMNRVQQQRAVYAALKGKMDGPDGELHALQLTTRAPD